GGSGSTERGFVRRGSGPLEEVRRSDRAFVRVRAGQRSPHSPSFPPSRLPAFSPSVVAGVLEAELARAAAFLAGADADVGAVVLAGVADRARPRARLLRLTRGWAERLAPDRLTRLELVSAGEPHEVPGEEQEVVAERDRNRGLHAEVADEEVEGDE